MRRLGPLFLAALALFLQAPELRAQGGAALSTTLDASVRSAGMGRASSAVFWGGDPDAWANPALLGYHEGVRFEYGRTQLVPDLADDVTFKTRRITLGAYGLGILLAGKPVDGAGSMRLSYGTSQATGPGGEDLGTYESYEEIRAFGIGLSLAQATEALWRASGHTPPPLARYGDVALGMTKKDVTVFLSPSFSGMPGVGGDGTAEDRGLFLRLSPYNTFDRDGEAAGFAKVMRARLDLGHGRSTINRGQPLVDLGPDVGSEPMIEESRKGWSTHVALHPVALDRSLEDARLGWLARSLSPAFSLGAAWEDQTERFSTRGASTDESAIDKHGWELTLLNIVSMRRGHYSDPDGSIDGPTTGWSVGFALVGVAGFRYDRATVPQALDLAKVHRKAWSFFIDPLRAMREL
ncbi:MAG: hypothetical protein ABI783_06855 [Actinomycetota bacterium]